MLAGKYPYNIIKNILNLHAVLEYIVSVASILGSKDF